MHIVQKNNKLKEDVKEVRKVPHQNIHLGTLKPKKGHSIFRFKDGDLRKVRKEDFENKVVLLQNGKTRVVRKLKVEKGALYVSALNEKNALKKLYNSICE